MIMQIGKAQFNPTTILCFFSSAYVTWISFANHVFISQKVRAIPRTIIPSSLHCCEKSFESLRSLQGYYKGCVDFQTGWSAAAFFTQLENKLKTLGHVATTPAFKTQLLFFHCA